MTAEEKKAYMKEYREKNKEKIKEYKKEYMKSYKEKNKEKINEYNKEYMREYYEKNKDKTKGYKEKNKDKRKEWYKVYYNKNKDRLNEKSNQHMTEKNDVSRKTAFNHHQEWTPEEDTILIKLKKQGKPYKEIGKILGRSIQSVSMRLVRLRKADPFNGVPHDDI